MMVETRQKEKRMNGFGGWMDRWIVRRVGNSLGQETVGASRD